MHKYLLTIILGLGADRLRRVPPVRDAVAAQTKHSLISRALCLTLTAQ